MSDIMISMRGVTKAFPGASSPAVTNLDIDVRRGDIVCFIGPSGCGKSTSLKMINRLIEPTAGTIEIDGADIAGVDPPTLRRGIGYVIQQVGLFPHRRVGENIAAVPKLLGWDGQKTDRRVEELISTVGLSAEMVGRYPAELSGGQQQRVGVARALAADPPLLLMDEPYSAVDPLVRSRLQDELLELNKKVGKTIVFVTHDIDEALKIADRIAIFNTGGILEQYGSPLEILSSPASDFVRDFVGAERGLKRLSLLTVGDIELSRGPVVELGSDIERARALMADHGVDWVGLCSGDRLLGWVWESDLNDAGVLDAEPRARFDVSVTPASSLRAALDAIVTNATEVAVVNDGPTYLGMLLLADLRRELTGQ